MSETKQNSVELPELDILQRFDVPGPRYTSYPTADRFKKEFGPEDYKEVLEKPRNGISLRQLCLCMFIFRSAPISATTADATKRLLKIIPALHSTSKL